ncbi:MAG: lasso peptide [Cyanobacteria bacterium J06555_3]
MKKTYSKPQLTVHGSVDVLTQQTKGLGSDDGVTLVIDGLTPPSGVPIGSL